ncbi:MAG: hypothetical protein V4488_17495 [Pseudomonadota bacterium]
MQILIGAVFAVLILCLAVLVFLGAFRQIAIVEQNQGPFVLLYRDMMGADMKKIGEITDSLDTLLEAAGIRQRRPMDVFFPDGRAEIGFAIEGVSEQQLKDLAEQARLKEIPAQRCMLAEFPWHHPVSYMLAYFKVDPALAKYRAAHAYQKVEAMTLHGDGVILYLQPIVAA